MQALSGKHGFTEKQSRGHTESQQKKRKDKEKKTLLNVFNTSGSYLHKNEIINIRIFPVHETGPVR